ncbi:MAG: EFR1 family ferrodoxin [Oscillospiraceae bacterium]|nr:EFR1 family ferrodoxin [Oscillospiraceae bacterium]
MTIFYFTATGNSLDIAKRLGAHFGAVLRSIPQADTATDYTDDVIGVVFPVYAWNIPAIVTRFLKRVTLTAQYKFAVAAHGGEPGEIGGILTKIAAFDNVFTVGTWSNYLPFNNDVPPVAVDVVPELTQIVRKIEAREKRIFELGNAEPFDAAPWAGMALEYNWRDNCNACGVCSRVCPVGNCKPVHKFASHCEGCMACLQNCPEAALFMPGEPTRYRYRNPNVTTDEIIAANEQTAVL